MAEPGETSERLRGIAYGSVRNAFGLGPGSPTSDRGSMELEGGTETRWRAPEVPCSDRAQFFAQLNVQRPPNGSKVKAEPRTLPSADSLRHELIASSRRAHIAQSDSMRRCPKRKQAEAKITAAWARSAGATGGAPAQPARPTEETPRVPLRDPPQLPLRTPDPLHSPFPRFPGL